MSDEYDQNLEAPPPRKKSEGSLQKKAEAIVRLYGITFGQFKGRRCMYVDNPPPPDDLELVSEASRQGLI